MTEDEKRLSALYQSLDKENSPEHVDARILAMAKQGALVHTVPLDAKQPSRWTAWRWPLSSVVSAALLVGILFFTTSPLLPPEEQAVSASSYDMVPTAPKQARREYQAMPEQKRQLAQSIEREAAAARSKTASVLPAAQISERLAEVDRLVASGELQQAGTLLMSLVEEAPEAKARLSEGQLALLQEALHRRSTNQ